MAGILSNVIVFNGTNSFTIKKFACMTSKAGMSNPNGLLSQK